LITLISKSALIDPFLSCYPPIATYASTNLLRYYQQKKYLCPFRPLCLKAFSTVLLSEENPPKLYKSLANNEKINLCS